MLQYSCGFGKLRLNQGGIIIDDRYEKEDMNKRERADYKNIKICGINKI